MGIGYVFQRPLYHRLMLDSFATGGVYWPFTVVAVGMVFVVVMIVGFRVHAFIALMLAAILVGFLAESLPGEEEGNHFVRAINLSMAEFGNTAGSIAWVIALASLIGLCLMESGAADRIVRQLTKVLGEERAGWALLVCGFLLGIPVFFDTVFFLLIPLARALSFRVGKHYVYYITAIFSGSVITHSLVPPTPGPLFMVEALNLNLGQGIMLGVLAGILPAVGAMLLGRMMDHRMKLPIRDTSGLSLTELEDIVSKPDSELPSFTLSLLPVLLPVGLIALESCVSTFGLGIAGGPLSVWISVLGNKYIAMFLGALIALYLLAWQKRMNFSRLGDAMGPPLSTAGVIILITAAGGAFGTMIKHAGVGEAVQKVTEGTGFSMILLGWLLAVIMKVAQGSGTVSMITTSGMMAAIVGDGLNLGYDPLYIFLAIGFGSMVISWMNDSGFWVVCKLSGFTEQETLKTWSLTLAVISLIGLGQIILVSTLLPFPFGR